MSICGEVHMAGISLTTIVISFKILSLHGKNQYIFECLFFLFNNLNQVTHFKNEYYIPRARGKKSCLTQFSNIMM